MNIVKLKNDRMTVEHLEEQGLVINDNPLEYQGKDLDGFVPNEDRTVWTKQSSYEETDSSSLPLEDEHVHVTPIEWNRHEVVSASPHLYEELGRPDGWKRILNKNTREVRYVNPEHIQESELDADWITFDQEHIKFVPGDNPTCTPEEYNELPDERPTETPIVDPEHWTVNGEGHYEEEPTVEHVDTVPEYWTVNGEGHYEKEPTVTHVDTVYGEPVELDVHIKSDFLHIWLIGGDDGYTLASGVLDGPGDEMVSGDWAWIALPTSYSIAEVADTKVEEEPYERPSYVFYIQSKWRVDMEFVNEFDEPVPYVWVWDELTPFENCSMTPEEFCEWYDDTFRGKYVLAINETWLARMDMTVASYIYMSQNPDEICMPLEDHPNLWCLPMVNFQPFVDTEITSQIAESLRTKYNNLNNVVNPEDIDVNAVKVFRKWLAESLLGNLESLEGFEDKDRMSHMLNYYANNLYDSTVRSLSEMGVYMNEKPLVMSSNGKPLNITLQSGCGCNGGVSAFDQVGVSMTCDPVQMYRNAMYNYMVAIFSSIKYWEAQPEICIEMKRYIDAILKLGLVLRSSIIDPYADCTCGSVDGDINKNHRVMLQNLSTALEYIIQGKTDGNRNFISQAFTQWATYLYEYMYWM